MATTPEIVREVSRIMSIPQPTVETTARRLGEGDLIPRGSRGRAAPQIDAVHVARLLTGVMSITDGIKGTVARVVQAVDRIGRSHCHGTLKWSETDDFTDALVLVPGGSFIEQVTHLIQQCADPNIAERFKLSVNAVGVTFGGEFPLGWVEVSGHGELLLDRLALKCIPELGNGRRVIFGSYEPSTMPGMIREARLSIDALAELAQLFFQKSASSGLPRESQGETPKRPEFEIAQVPRKWK